jgi:hypothetical protein
MECKALRSDAGSWFLLNAIPMALASITNCVFIEAFSVRVELVQDNVVIRPPQIPYTVSLLETNLQAVAFVPPLMTPSNCAHLRSLPLAVRSLETDVAP